MRSWLHQIDVAIFRLINETAGGPLDALMLTLTSRTLWLVLGVAVVATALYRRRRRFVLGCLFILMSLGISDFVTFTVLKPGFDRDRPCYQLEDVKLIQSRCGSQFGFPSNHAANGMAAAVAAGLYFGFRRAWFLVPIAVLIGYTRVYLGVHFPFDILFGFLVGALYALACWIILWRPLAPKIGRLVNRMGFFG